VAGSLVAAALGNVTWGQQAATRPAAPATQPATTQSANGARLSLNFKDAPLDTVLDYLSQQAGFAVIKDGPVDGRVTIQSKQPVSPEEAITLVNAALKVNGFTMVREDRLLRVTAREKAKKGSIPVRFGNKPEEIAATDELITQVVPLQNVSATKLRDDLKPLIAPEADVAANDASNTIVVTDTSSNIRRLVRIIAAMDQQEAATLEIRTIPLKSANAAQAVKLIETFFKNAGGGPALTPQQQQMMMQQGQPIPQRSGGDRRGQTVVAASDDRTNTLIVQASAGTLKGIEELIKKLDSNPVPVSEMRAFPLKFAQAEATAKLINNLYKPPKPADDGFPFFIRRFGMDDSDSAKKGPAVNAQFDERTNTLIVTAPADALKAVEETVKMLDASPMTATDLRVFQLKYADAYTVSKLIEDVFKPKDDSGPRFPFIIFSDGPSPEHSKGVRVTVTSDDRTNSLIVSAPQELMKVIEGMVQKLDANPATEDTLFIYHLRNGQAQNLEYVLNVLFGNINAPNQNGAQNGQIQATSDNGGQRRSINNNNNDNNDNGNSSFNNNRRNNNGNRRNNRNLNGMPRLSPGMASAVNALTGKVFVVADPDTNALLVTTASKYEKQVRAIIDDLDRPVPQVLIKVLVAEVKHDNSADLGVDFSVLNKRDSGNGQSISTKFGAPGTGLVVSILEEHLTATLHALAEEDKLDVLSRPYLLASDNQLASMLIGQSVPFINDTRITDTGQQINNIVYRDIGLSLNVTPHINPDGVVILDVEPEVSQLTSQEVPISSTTFAPVIAKRSAESRIAVKDGQTIVIGGLMEDRKTTAITKVPLLGDIPLIGAAFSRTQATKTKTELLIFLTPHVAARPESLQPMSEDEERGTKLTPKAVAPGVFEEHMEGMQRGRSPETRPTGPVSPVNPIDLSTPPDDKPAPEAQSLIPSTPKPEK
jgi:general secretion pathway protein D